jgi:hypothetical protein
MSPRWGSKPDRAMAGSSVTFTRIAHVLASPDGPCETKSVKDIS